MTDAAWDDDEYEIPEVPTLVPTPQNKWTNEDIEDIKNNGNDGTRNSLSSSKSKSTKGNDSYTRTITRELTEKEKLESQRRSDLTMFMETLGIEDDTESEQNYLQLSSLSSFKDFSDRLSAVLVRRHKSDHYPDFLAHLFYTLAEKTESRHIRRICTDLKNLADLKSVQENATKKSIGKTTTNVVKTAKKEQKSKKKPTSGFEDFSVVGGGRILDEDEDEDYDDDDFM